MCDMHVKSGKGGGRPVLADAYTFLGVASIV